MLRLRSAGLALAAGLVFSSGCCCPHLGLFERDRCCCPEPAAACCPGCGETAGLPVAEGPLLEGFAPGGCPSCGVANGVPAPPAFVQPPALPAPQPAIPPLTQPPQPPRLEPIPQAQPIPYAPQG